MITHVIHICLVCKTAPDYESGDCKFESCWDHNLIITFVKHGFAASPIALVSHERKQVVIQFLIVTIYLFI